MSLHTLPLALSSAASAGRNAVLRDGLMAQARKAQPGSHRRYLVYCARQHNKLLVDAVVRAKECFSRATGTA